MSVLNYDTISDRSRSEQFQILYGFTLFKTNIAVVVILNEVSFKKIIESKKEDSKIFLVHYKL